MGGLLTLPSFVAISPEIDTTTQGTAGLTKSQAEHKSTIQGMCQSHVPSLPADF
jgi:hypothetical protein